MICTKIVSVLKMNIKGSGICRSCRNFMTYCTILLHAHPKKRPALIGIKNYCLCSKTYNHYLIEYKTEKMITNVEYFH